MLRHALTLQRQANGQNMPISMGTTARVTSTNDGGVCITRLGTYTGSNRYGTVPVMSLEVSGPPRATQVL